MFLSFATFAWSNAISDANIAYSINFDKFFDFPIDDNDDNEEEEEEVDFSFISIFHGWSWCNGTNATALIEHDDNNDDDDDDDDDMLSLNDNGFILLIPHWLSNNRLHTDSDPQPRGVTSPKPVITTLFNFIVLPSTTITGKLYF